MVGGKNDIPGFLNIFLPVVKHPAKEFQDDRVCRFSFGYEIKLAGGRRRIPAILNSLSDAMQIIIKVFFRIDLPVLIHVEGDHFETRVFLPGSHIIYEIQVVEPDAAG